MIQAQTIQTVTCDGETVVATADVGAVRLTAYSENTIHMAYSPTPQPADLPMWGIRPRQDCAPMPVVHVTDNGWFVELPGVSVRIQRDPMRFDFLDRQGGVLTSLKMVGLLPVRISGEQTHHVYAAFTSDPDEAYYGLGQHQTDWMDQRGRVVQLWHDYKAHGGEIIGVPFLVTNRRYGVIWDNVSRGSVKLGRDDQNLWWSEVGDAVSLFVMAADEPDGLYREYRELTGPTPLPPLSALGYIQCKQRYKSRDELMYVARTYREKGYPCDILVVDWFHWKTLGDLSLDPEHWPDPAGMTRELADDGYHVMISCWPRFMADSRHYETLDRAGWLMTDAAGQALCGTPDDPRGALIDTTNPDAARWYWRAIHESYGQQGFSSWWLDENEPDICPHPFYLHAGSGARVHNLYPLTHTRAIYDGHRRDRDDRCLILSRSAYLGAQSTGSTFWSSDIHPTWDVFRRQIPCGLNFCATGLAYWSSDIGGWNPLPQHRQPDSGYQSLLVDTGQTVDDAKDLEDYTGLYVRWFQYGAFCPTFRAHGTRPANEVWSYGEAAETILVKYLRLRYRLLPYIYSLCWQTAQTGAPFMRAMALDFPDDPNVRDLKYQYMFGPAFLVAPVYEPGADSREVYLPVGTDWYDYWTGRRYQGGQTILADAPLETLPLFVRAGSIVPHGEDIPHTGVPQTRIDLHVYEGADAHFDLYRDDGTTYAYESGAYTVTSLLWDDAAGALTIENDAEGLFRRPVEQYLRRIGG